MRSTRTVRNTRLSRGQSIRSVFGDMGGGGNSVLGPVTPANAYVAEDNTTFYVAEDGTTYYVQET